MLCGGILSDSLFKDALSGRIYGGAVTSVVDNTAKVAGYIYACRQMNIQLLPPDVNESERGFFR